MKARLSSATRPWLCSQTHCQSALLCLLFLLPCHPKPHHLQFHREHGWCHRTWMSAWHNYWEFTVNWMNARRLRWVLQLMNERSVRWVLFISIKMDQLVFITQNTVSWEGWLEWIKKCDFYAIFHVRLSCFCFENESIVISNFWKQIVVSTVNMVNKISRNSGCAL